MIYADNAATTRISDVAFEKMLPYLQEQYGNASSQYSLGAKAKRAIGQARKQVAAAIGAEAAEITFTSGGSEANSWVLRGVADSFKGESIHIITSTIEHHSILNACHNLEAMGVEVTYLPVNSDGVVEVETLKEAIKPNTKLVSIMLANNEIGTVQPVAEIGQYLHDKGILFHTDAVQAVGHIPVEVNELHVDFLSASAHKFNGSKGTGILFKCSGVDLPNLVFGGEQEHGSRAGTENVAGIVAMGYALEESVKDMQETAERLRAMVQTTVTVIQKRIPNVWVNGKVEPCLPGTVNLGFNGVSGESLMNILDLKGVCVSTSSACNSGKDEPSHVLLALGLSEKQAKSAIRISYGRFNTEDDAEVVANAVCDAYDKIIGASYNAVNLTILPDDRTIYQYTKGDKTQRITFHRIKKYWDHATAEKTESVTVSVQNQYIICILIVASGQGGIVFVWDTEKSRIVHLSKASYAVKSIIFEGNVISLCHVAHYGTRPYFALTCSEFNTLDAWKEPMSFVVEGIEDDLDNKYSTDNYTLRVDGDSLICEYKTQVCIISQADIA